MKKVISTFLILFTLLINFSLYAPVVSYAEGTTTQTKGGNSVGDVTVEIDNNGNLSVKGGSFDANSNSSSVWNEIIKKYKVFIAGVSGVGAVTALAIFIIMFMKLGASAGNPQARSQALTGLLWSGIATAGLGSVTIIVGLFYGIFR